MGIVPIPCRTGGGPLVDLRQSGGHHSWEGFPTDRGLADSSNDEATGDGGTVNNVCFIYHVALRD